MIWDLFNFKKNPLQFKDYFSSSFEREEIIDGTDNYPCVYFTKHSHCKLNEAFPYDFFEICFTHITGYGMNHKEYVNFVLN